MKFENDPTSNSKKKKKKIETEITWGKLLKSFLSLINQNKKELA